MGTFNLFARIRFWRALTVLVAVAIISWSVFRANPEAADQSMSWPWLMLGAVLIWLVLNFLEYRFLVDTLAKPLERLDSQLAGMAADQTGPEDAGIAQSDATGGMERHLKRIRERLQALESAMHNHIAGLAVSTRAIAANGGTVAQSASDIGSAASQVSTLAAQEAKRAQKASESAETVSLAVSSVAGAIEQMSGSLNEVAKACQKELTMAGEANTKAGASLELVKRLGIAACEIGKVVDVINDIAEQTDLLALNATIEAASAGEAGRSFAVVAGEVKELAKQTAGATGEIQRKIEEIQAAARESANAIEAIAKAIHEVNDVSESIAGAVEEQSATVNEIAGNVVKASQSVVSIAETSRSTASGLDQAAGEIQKLSASAAIAGEAAVGIQKQIREMEQMTGSLAKLCPPKAQS